MKTIDNGDVDYMLYYVKLSETQNEPEEHVAIKKAISKLAFDVVKDRKAFEEIKTKTPELSKLMQNQGYHLAARKVWRGMGIICNLKFPLINYCSIEFG